MAEISSFRVTFRGDPNDVERVADALYGVCDDATVSVERDGSAGYADVDGEATDALSAVVSAVEQIEKVGFVATSVGDLVTVAGIPERTARSQQTVSAWTTGVRGPGGFPTSRIDRHWGAVYSWAEVTQWLARHRLAGLDLTAVQVAAARAAVNTLLDARATLRALPTPAVRRARRLLAA